MYIRKSVTVRLRIWPVVCRLVSMTHRFLKSKVKWIGRGVGLANPRPLDAPSSSSVECRMCSITVLMQ